MNLFQKKTNDTTKINEINFGSKSEKIVFKLLNIFIIIIIIVTIVNTIDSICVKKYNKGPFFAIPFTVYKDGGTKVYYGLGYKVIKYHQTQGRRDTQMGSWFLRYSSSPTSVEPIDLALEFRDNPNKSYKKYKGSFLKISAKLDEIDLDANEAIIKYTDKDKKYTLEIVCKMAEGEDVINNIVGTDVVVLGTVDTYSVQTKKSPNKLIIKDAFIG